MQITKTSMFTGKKHTMDLDVTEEQLRMWTTRQQLIQDAMPNLTCEEREFLITGVTPEEWNAEFPPEED